MTLWTQNLEPITQTSHPCRWATFSPLILHVSAGRAYWSLKDRNVVKTVWWVLRRFISYWYLLSGRAHFLEVSFLVVIWRQRTPVFALSALTRSGQICTGRRSNCKSTISGASWQGCHKTWNFRPNLVAIWSTSEKSTKLSYIIGNLDWVRNKHEQHDIT